MTTEGNTGVVALGWTHATLLAPRGDRGAAAATRHSFLHTSPLLSHNPHIQYLPSLSPSSAGLLGFLPHMPCQPPKTSSPCFLHSVWCLSTVFHLQAQSTALSFSSTSIHFPVLIPPCNPLITSVSPWELQGHPAALEQLPAASAMSWSFTLFHLWTTSSPQSQPVYLTIHPSPP